MADESDFVDPYDFSFEIRDEESARLPRNQSCTAYARQSRSDLTTGVGNNVIKSESPAEGYAEFFRLVARHRIQVFSELKFDLEQLAGRGTLGKGGTYIVHCGELLKPLAPDDESTASGALPLLSKCHDELFQCHRPIEVDNLKEGTVVVSKHINIEGRPTVPEPGDYLPSLIREALVLSHPTIREKMGLPSLFGFGIETLVADHSGHSQQFPIMLLEMGSGGNLEEWFRGMWRAKSSQRKRGLSMGREEVRFTGQIESKLVFSWKRKMHMASQLASALAALHEVGVVHGDVKATNVICCPLRPKDPRPHSENFLQLCDLGSCVILSDIAAGAKSTLLSYSPPWNAPESTSRLDRTGLVKTDVYSFGLLLARILLDGNHPFDEDYHIISGKQSAHDATWLSGLQKNDLVIEHVISQILKQFDTPTIVEDEAAPNKFFRVLRRGRDPGFDGCAYTESQRVIVKMLIGATLRSSPYERLGSMRRLAEFLGLAKTDSDEELVKYASIQSVYKPLLTVAD